MIKEKISLNVNSIWWRRLLILGPIAWVVLFFAIPFAIIIKISFSHSIFSAPPYAPMLEWVGNHALNIKLTFENYYLLFNERLYISSYLNSLYLAAISTIFCLLIGYPMAYGIAHSHSRWRHFLLLMIILPFWTSFLIRVYAWMGLLSNTGFINSLLIKIGLISAPLPLLHNNFAVCIGIIYTYLPFMILPLYASVEKVDPILIEASADLGAKPISTFFKVTLPLTFKGILTGSMLVFIPAVGEFVIPELLGGPNNPMIGKILWMEFFSNLDWPVASAIAVALLILLVIPMIIFQRIQMRRNW